MTETQSDPTPVAKPQPEPSSPNPPAYDSNNVVFINRQTDKRRKALRKPIGSIPSDEGPEAA